MTYWQGDARSAIPLLQRGLDGLDDPVACSFTHANFLNIMALSYANCGEQQAALDLLRTALAEATTHHRPTMMVFLGSHALVHLYAGELALVASTAEQMLELADSPQAPPDWSGSGMVRIWRGWARYFLGAVQLRAK